MSEQSDAIDALAQIPVCVHGRDATCELCFAASLDRAYHCGLTDDDPDAFIMGDDGSPQWAEYWRGVRDRQA